MRYGDDAIAIARSSYDIQSAIPGMAEGALATFTYQGALLAKAGKTNAAEATEYMGTSYNIFKDYANKIGQGKWVQQLTGQTTHAVKIFKTTTSAMGAAFKSLGSMGVQMDVGMPEQIAAQGTLQATMSVPEAGTAYKSMLDKYDQAQKVLGTSFKNADGKMLPTYEIISKIDNKLGNLDKDQKVAALTKAFISI